MKNLTKVLIMFSFFSLACSPKAKYKILTSEKVLYEFNPDRNKVYYISKDNINVYNPITDETKVILKNANIDRYYHSPFYLTKNGLFLITKDKFYKIEDEKLEAIPILYNKSNFVKDTGERLAETKKEIKHLNKLIKEYNGNEVFKYSPVTVLKYPDNHKVAIESFRLRRNEYFKVDIGNIDKLERLTKVVEPLTDTTYRIKNILFSKAVNYFDNNNLTITEKMYSCKSKKKGIKALFGGLRYCKYNIYIKQNKHTVKLKDTSRKFRKSIWNSKIINGKLNYNITDSNYISDKYGNVYIVFNIDGNDKLIKIEAKQFGL